MKERVRERHTQKERSRRAAGVKDRFNALDVLEEEEEKEKEEEEKEKEVD